VFTFLRSRNSAGGVSAFEWLLRQPLFPAFDAHDSQRITLLSGGHPGRS
jgi:hypothetical protein